MFFLKKGYIQIMTDKEALKFERRKYRLSLLKKRKP